MNYNEIVNLFKKSTYVTAITKNMPKDVVETVFNRTLEAGLNPIMPLTQIAVENSGIPKLHVKNDNSHNWFNITARGSEKYVTYPVPEYTRSGKKGIRNVNFRVFDSLNDAVDAFIALIKRSYPHYNELNSKSLIHKNGAAYASAEYSGGKTYTQYVVDEVHNHLNRLGIKDHSFENLQKLFSKSKHSTFKTLTDANDKTKLAKKLFDNSREIISEKLTTKKPTNTNTIVSTKNKTSTKKTIASEKVKPIDLGTTVIRSKKTRKDYSTSHSSGYQLEFIPNGVYITYGGKTILMINSTSASFENFVKLIIKGVKNEANWEDKAN